MTLKVLEVDLARMRFGAVAMVLLLAVALRHVLVQGNDRVFRGLEARLVLRDEQTQCILVALAGGPVAVT